MPSRIGLQRLAAIILPFLLVAGTPIYADTRSADSWRVNGAKALAHVEQLVALGPRAAGSRQLEQARRYLESAIAATGLRAERQPFSASTPGGPLPMTNLLVKIPAQGKPAAKRVLLTGHFDTKRFLDRNFVGANDGGSSAALLLELARVLALHRPTMEVWIVFFDGEEAIGTWSDTDSLYGSRHLARQLQQSGELSKVRALINIDMIGDRDLHLLDEYYSDAGLRQLARETSLAMGKPQLIGRELMAVEDDHLPFVRRGVPSLNLIDFNYGPGNRYWHTEEDSLDKLSADSLATVGNLVLGILKRLEAE